MRVFLVLLISIFLLATPVSASRGLIITSDKNNINEYEEILVNASPSGFINEEDVYIKGAFYKEDSSNYFGLTKIGDVWIKNSSPYIDQLKIKPNNWDGKMIVKSDYSDSGFIGSGSYKLKIGYYYLTSGGNISSVNWSNALDVNIVAPVPTPSNSPTPTKTPSPNISSSIPISTANSVFKNTPAPTLVKLSATDLPQKTISNNVLGLNDIFTPIPNLTSSIKPEDAENKFPFGALAVIFLGIVFISTSIYMAVKTSKLPTN